MTKKIIIVSLTILALFTTGAVVYLRKQFPQKPSANNTRATTATTTRIHPSAMISLVAADEKIRTGQTAPVSSLWFF